MVDEEVVDRAVAERGSVNVKGSDEWVGGGDEGAERLQEELRAMLPEKEDWVGRGIVVKEGKGEGEGEMEVSWGGGEG